MKFSSQHSSRRLILIAAARFEAAPTMSFLADLGIPYTFIEVGVGAVMAARVATSLRSLAVERDVLFLGSCGTSNFFQASTLVTPREVLWNPSDVRRRSGYLVTNAEPGISLTPIPALTVVTVSCSGSITLQKEDEPDIYENLELYSVAAALGGVCRRFSAVLGVTNELGPRAHEQWKAHFKNISDLTATHLKEHIDSLYCETT